MTSEAQVLDTIKQFQGTGKTFAEFIAELFKDQIIEVYVGDAYEDISTEQVSTTYPAVFCGEVVAAYRECLIIKCAFVNNGKHLQMGNLLFINERAIRALNAVDGKGILEDMMLRSKESLDIATLFSKK